MTNEKPRRVVAYVDDDLAKQIDNYRYSRHLRTETAAMRELLCAGPAVLNQTEAAPSNP